MNDNNIAEDDTNPNIKQLHYILYIVLYARLVDLCRFVFILKTCLPHQTTHTAHTRHTHAFLTAARAGEKVNGR